MEKAKLSAKITKTTPNQQLLAQAVRVFLSNKRKAIAKTKSRSEVNKTTAKMYKQKGTGRARHGAYSAPIFVGGGVAFGPRGNQNYSKNLSKSQKKLAVVSALLAKDKKLFTFDWSKVKNTKSAANELRELKGSILIILGSKELKSGRFFRNLPKVTVVNSQNLNTYQVLKHQNLLFSENSLDEVNQKYAN